MVEFLIGVQGIVALLFVVAACFFYMWGGRAGSPGKWLRRFIASLILATGCNTIAIWIGHWHWQYVLVYPALIIGFSNGYGGDTLIERLLRRIVYEAGLVAAGLVCCWALGWSGAAITVLICQGLCAVTGVILGLKNPLPAAIEEVLVCLVSTVFIVFYPFIVMAG